MSKIKKRPDPRLFIAAWKAFEDEGLGRQHSDMWSQIPTEEQRQVLELLGSRQFDTVLDLGCGPGWYAFVLSGWKRYVGVDQSAVWLRLAKANTASLTGVELIHSWVEDLDFADEADLGLCIGVFQHHARPRELLEKICSLNVRYLCFNLMVTNNEKSEDFLWDEWGKISEGMPKQAAKAFVKRAMKLLPGKVVGKADRPYGMPLPQLTWECYLLERIA